MQRLASNSMHGIASWWCLFFDELIQVRAACHPTGRVYIVDKKKKERAGSSRKKRFILPKCSVEYLGMLEQGHGRARPSDRGGSRTGDWPWPAIGECEWQAGKQGGARAEYPSHPGGEEDESHSGLVLRGP